jgi:hypothetical protein
MQSDQNLIDLAAFAKAHFRPSKKSSKKSAPADDPSVASESAALIPLLKSVDHKNSKAAVKLFSYVVAYGKNANERPLASFVENLSLELVDEAFMQVIRQTRQNPSPEATVRMWHLLLCLSTLFFASPVIQPVVRQTLATAAFGGNVVIAQFAQLAYFRFDARCQIGAHVKAPPAQFVESIPSHVNECHMTLGASLCELMWHQRTTFPKCRVPVFMHRICKALIGQGAFEKEGVFKNVGNQVVVEKLCADIDNGTAALADADLTVLATVFKRWLALLPWPMVPIDVYPKLLEQDQGKNYVAIADDLPRISRDSLAYLVGFLKDFVKAEPRTGMGLVPVAMMFGLTVVRPSHFHQTKMRELYEVSKDFMVALVQSWDVSDVYPLNEALYL